MSDDDHAVESTDRCAAGSEKRGRSLSGDTVATMLLTLLLGCDATAPPSQTLPLTPCHVTGLDAESLCGPLTVAENPSAPDGKTIDLHVRGHSRDSYAYGALAAAKFLAGKPAGSYSMNDVLGL